VDGWLTREQLSQAVAGRQEGIVVAVSPWAEVSVAQGLANSTF